MTKEKKKKETEDKILELENNWKRALADYQNLQKRTAEERESIVKFANAVLVLRMLPVLDNLKIMEKHIKDKGLKMTIEELEKVLEEEGLDRIKVKGKKFSSKTMEAIEMVKGEEGKVVEVIQEGYLFKGKILRPARVKVGQKGKVK